MDLVAFMAGQDLIVQCLITITIITIQVAGFGLVLEQACC
jgi:hypothetical protein